MTSQQSPAPRASGHTLATGPILVTGISGQVGGALMKAGAPKGLTLLGRSREDLDLSRPETIEAALDRADPRLIVNCAAYTAVDKAESEPALAMAANADGPEAIARWCRAHGRTMIHLSTDYVFDGRGTRPYREDDPIAPTSVYGASKAEGERRIRAVLGEHVILRTAWVYAAEGRNFVRTMLRLGAERDEIGVVADQLGCPTSADSIAEAVLRIVERLGKGQESLFGTYHYVDSGETSWAGFAEEIFRLAERRMGRRPRVVRLTTDQYPTPTRRPAYSALDTTKARTVFDLAPPAWQDSLELVLGRILGPA